MPKEIKITKEYEGVKPKNFLKKTINTPFNTLVKLIKDKRITLNLKKIKKEDILKEGDIIKIWKDDILLRQDETPNKAKKDLSINIIYECEDFIVFNKLPFIVVQGAQDHDTSLSLHLTFYKDRIGDKNNFEYSHVHRLDKETSGALLVAKNRIALRGLNQIFKEKKVKKKYICLCKGEFAKDRGEIDVFMIRNPQGAKEKMSVAKHKDSNNKKNTQRSISFYRVIDKFEYENETFSLVEVEIKTGVTHQIRVHMKHLGHPIVADKMYGNSIVNSMFQDMLQRQFLHASHLEFAYKGKNYKFEAPLTKDLENFLYKLKKE